MNKNLKFALAASSAAFLAACNYGTPDNGKDEVDSYSDLPACAADVPGGQKLLGDTLYIVETDMFYHCSETGWVLIPEVANAKDIPACDPKGENGIFVGDTILVKKTGEYYICTDNGWTVENNKVEAELVITDATISGNAAGFGPFEFGTKIILEEAVVEGDSITFTGKQYEDEISNNKGDFVIPKVSLHSNYAKLSIEGNFMDPLTGEISDETMSLSALVDVSNGSANINLLTAMEYDRIVALIQAGYTMDAAKLQAQKEIMRALGMSTNVEKAEELSILGAENADAMLLAITLLFRGENDASDLADIITAFAEDLADGTWDDEDAKTQMADFAYNLQNLKLVDETSGEIRLKESDYRKHMEAWNVGDIAAFEANINRFWGESFGLGKCSAARQSVVLKNVDSNSGLSEEYFTCESEAWRKSTDIEKDTVTMGYAPDGTLAQGLVNDTIWYVYDTAGTGAGTPTRWKEADSISVYLEESCTDEKDMRLKVVKTIDDDDNDNFYHCLNRIWQTSTEDTYNIGYPCVGDSLHNVAKLEDDQYRRCVDLGEGTYYWLPVTKVEWDLRKQECDPTKFVKYDGDSYVCTSESYWTFRAATALEKQLKSPCTEKQKDMEIEDEDEGKTYSCTESYGVYIWTEVSSV